MSKVSLIDRQLVGANGGLKVLYQTQPDTVSIDVSHNALFGPEGLQYLLDGLVELNPDGKGKQPKPKLRSLKLTDCGLQIDFYDVRALNLLATYLPHLPELNTLDLTNNSLTLLPPAFLSAVLAHPTLSTLILSSNPLGSLPDASNLHTLLTSLTNAPSTSHLKSLHLTLTSLSSASGPHLLRLLQTPAPGGLLDLRLNANALSPANDLRPLLDALKGKAGNRFIQKLEIYGCYDDEDDFQSTVEAGELVASLGPYLDRNRRLLRETREAAKQVVRVGRTLLLAVNGEAGEGEPATRAGGGGGVFPLLSLPTELMQPILGNLVPGALSQKQVARLIGWIGERNTLSKGLDGEGVLREVGCWWWQAGP